MTVMPMFPLSSVLFPAMPLTLRIFEERYLKLLGDLMSADTPEFGVVLVSRESDTGGNENRKAIGTVASVTEIGTTDEFLGLESFGSRRFRVNHWLPDDPYPIADIEFLPDLTIDDSVMPALAHLETQVRKLLSLASEFGDLLFGADIELSDEPIKAAWQLAGIMPIGELDRLDLLDSQSAEELLAKTYSIATNGIETVREMLASNGESGGLENR